MVVKEQVFYLEANELNMVLADEVKRKIQALIFYAPVTLYSRTAHIQFLTVPTMSIVARY